MKLIESGNENPRISSAKFILSFEPAAEQIQIELHCKEARHVCAFSSFGCFYFVCVHSHKVGPWSVHQKQFTRQASLQL